MNEMVPEALTVLPNPALFRAARWMQRISLGVVLIAVLFGFLPLLGLPIAASTAAEARGCAPILATALLSALSLALSAPGRTGLAYSYALRFVNFLVIFVAAWEVWWMRMAGVASGSGTIVYPTNRLAIGFVLLPVAVILVDRKNWFANRIVDVIACSLCLLSLLLVADSIFGSIALFKPSAVSVGFTASLVTLVALTAVVTLRQAEHGVFSVFLGVGIGSRLARIFAPILLLLPFGWALASAWAGHGSQSHLSTALLACSAAAASLGILMYFAWRISRMENEIHDLILRDEATRLYNHRGFHMLAEHALRLAQRSGVPFSILFVDLENLTEIHQELGPNAAATSLAEAGEILRSTFRESDIKGRIGPDEFAVAGQFDRAGISVAALRLEATTAARIARNGRAIPLKFSMGHVTTSEANVQENLKDLIARAGQARNRLDAQLNGMRIN
jgi:diguanylate cyclase (GGDEF)-like protein